MLKKETSVEQLWNLRKNIRQDLQAKGILTMEQFASLSLEEITKIKGIKSTATRYKAQAEAYVKDCPVYYGEMSPTLKQKGILFDLETDASPETGFHSWCMGWSDTDGNGKIAIVNARQAGKSYWLDEKTEIHIVRSPAAA